MDSLLEIIKKLKKEEIRNFKIFINRFQRTDEVKIASLFDLLHENSSEIDESKLVSKLFPADGQNMNAYYRLKNRLKTELEKSLLNLHRDMDERISVFNLITLSGIFTYKGQFELSIYYLKKAEKEALKNDFYDLLDLIYSELINLSHDYNEINPLEYIENRQANKQKQLVLMEANNAIASISYRLRKSNFNKAVEDINQTLQGIIDELHIANEVYKIPRVKFKIQECVRDILLQNQDFHNLENYMISTLKEFEDDGLFNKSNHRTKIIMVIFVINTLTVNKKWDKALEYANLLHDELVKYNKLYFDAYLWAYYNSLITNYMSSNRLVEAITLLEDMIENDSLKGKTVYDYSIYGNLALCYYFNRNQSAAIKVLSQFLTKDIYPKLSPQLQMSFSLMEIILHYENSNLDYASYKILEMKRQFRNLLKQTAYNEEKSFLKIIFSMCNKADPLKDKTIMRQIENFTGISSTVQVGSGKFIDYGLWLKVKKDRQWYYSAFLDSLQPAL